MGRVYLAELADARPYGAAGQRVALKVLKPDHLDKTQGIDRFEQEAALGLAVNHPAVARTFESGRDFVDGIDHHYLVMEYVEGRTLQTIFGELEIVPEPLLRHVGARIARGLS